MNISNPKRVVIVTNISESVSEKNIKDFFFAFCGKIEDFVLAKEKNSNSQIAYITFEKNNAAKTALKLTSSFIGDSQIVVKSADDSLRDNRKLPVMTKMSKKVVVTNIAEKVSEKTLKDFFLFCGKIKDFELVKEEKNNSQIAYITFERDNAVKTAIILSGAVINDSQIVVKSADGALFGGDDAHILSSKRVVVTNINKGIPEKTVKNIFLFCGTIDDIVLAKEESSDSQIAYITFERNDAAKMALTLSSTIIGNDQIVVKSADDFLRDNRKLSITTKMSKRVVVTNISEKASEKTIKSFFLFCGEIEDIVYVKEESSNSQIVYISFERDDAVKKAVMLSGAAINDSHIVVKSVDDFLCDSRKLSVMTKTPNRIVVTNIGGKASEKNIKDYFLLYGEIEDIVLVKEESNNSQIAYITFGEDTAAKRALLSSAVIGDSQIVVKSADDLI